MLCGICKAREATVFYTEIVAGTKKEQFLCEECAAKSTSLRLKAPFGGEEFSLGGLLLGLFENGGSEKGGKETAEETERGLSCSGCGMTYAEFKEKGQFGCASCYKEFGRLLLRNMRNIQGSDAHTGKHPKNVVVHKVQAPPKGAEEALALDETQRLVLQLEQAVEREEYELAAVLRDRIRERKKQEAGCADEKMV
ncbi:MAG: UvrB/UvrC motif-containing protein [Lachnospiraceae bacterium]|nr:UvrB/UvrC motif-containing protein [Lachnospiraceae bacterium]